MRPALLRSQRGVAVITALLLTTLAITIVASLFWHQQVQVRSIENQRLQLQNEWILRGALDWAGLILREDAKYSTIDTLDEPWSVSLADTRLDQYVDDGSTEGDVADASLSGGISDAQARYNLTNLCPGGTKDPAEVAVFGRLLQNVQLDPALAQAAADAMEASFIIPTAPATTSAGQPVPQPMALTQLDDLLAVPGFTSAMLDKLKDSVIFLPRKTPVNVNTAPAEVLAARINLSLSDANTIVEDRNTASFRDMLDFFHRAHINPNNSGMEVMTDYFLVNGKVRMNRAGLEVQALIERRGKGPNTKTQLIWIREQ